MHARITNAILWAVLGLFLVGAPAAWAISVKTETLQSCSAACDGDGTIVNASSFTTVVIQVCCSYTATVHFETSIDGTNYVAQECFSISDKTVRATSATTDGAWRCNMIGVNKLKARISGYSAGTILVTAGLASGGVY